MILQSHGLIKHSISSYCSQDKYNIIADPSIIPEVQRVLELPLIECGQGVKVSQPILLEGIEVTNSSINCAINTRICYFYSF